MPSYQHDPFINWNANLLKQAGTEEVGAGKATTESGLETLAPVEQYYTRLLGDTSAQMSAVQPEVDAITQQFNQVRQMISDQPRGGGKTSVLAELPVEQIKAISNLLAGARREAPAGLERVAGLKTGVGLSETGLGTGAAGEAAQIGLGGRQQDIASSWKSFFQNLIGQVVGGAAQGAASAAFL